LAPDLYGSVTSLGYNLIGNPTGSGGFAAPLDLIGLDSLLAPLGNHGGPTETMALLPGSPAIDTGSNALAVDATGNPLTTDQRGFARIVNGTADIGAFESRGFTLSVAGGNNQQAIVNSDGTAKLPANHTYIASDQGQHTFTGLILKKKGGRPSPCSMPATTPSWAPSKSMWCEPGDQPTKGESSQDSYYLNSDALLDVGRRGLISTWRF
jgi:hypothetical protein